MGRTRSHGRSSHARISARNSSESACRWRARAQPSNVVEGGGNVITTPRESCSWIASKSSQNAGHDIWSITKWWATTSRRCPDAPRSNSSTWISGPFARSRLTCTSPARRSTAAGCSDGSRLERSVMPKGGGSVTGAMDDAQVAPSRKNRSRSASCRSTSEATTRRVVWGSIRCAGLIRTPRFHCPGCGETRSLRKRTTFGSTGTGVGPPAVDRARSAAAAAASVAASFGRSAAATADRIRSSCFSMRRNCSPTSHSTSRTVEWSLSPTESRSVRSSSDGAGPRWTGTPSCATDGPSRARTGSGASCESMYPASESIVDASFRSCRIVTRTPNCLRNCELAWVRKSESKPRSVKLASRCNSATSSPLMSARLDVTWATMRSLRLNASDPGTRYPDGRHRLRQGRGGPARTRWYRVGGRRPLHLSLVLDPVALAREGVGRQWDPPPAAAVHVGPVHVHTRRPRVGEGPTSVRSRRSPWLRDWAATI